MTYDFSGPVDETTFDLIPAGFICWAWVNLRGEKLSGAGNRYLDLELTVDDGQPYARRKVWHNITVPFQPNIKEQAVNIGKAAIKHMLEVGRGASDQNPNAYHVSDDWRELHQIKVAILLGIEKGTGGYQDKNRVQQFLSPISSANRVTELFQKLMNGDHNLPTQAATPQQSFGFGQTGNGQAPANPPAPPPTQPMQPPPPAAPGQAQTPTWLADAQSAPQHTPGLAPGGDQANMSQHGTSEVPAQTGPAAPAEGGNHGQPQQPPF